MKIDENIAMPDSFTCHPVTLFFPGQLEKEFRYEHAERTRKLNTAVLLIAIAMNFIFGYIDCVIGAVNAAPLTFYRYAFFTPLMVLLTILYMLPFLRDYKQRILMLWSFSMIIQYSLRALNTTENGDPIFLAILIVINVLAAFVFRLHFMWTTLVIIAGNIAYWLIVPITLDMPSPVFISSSVLYTFVSVMGLYIIYSLEHRDRRTFYDLYKTALEQKRAQEQKRLLELRLKEQGNKLKVTANQIKREKEIRELSVEALVTSEEKYRELFENSGEPIIVVEPKERIIIDINPSGVELFGFGEETIGKKLDSLFSDSHERVRLFEILADQGTVTSHEVQLVTRNSETIYCLLTVRSVNSQSGDIEYYQFVVTDITERKHLEQQFIQAQKMESVGRLAGGVAHDFNNLLTALLGYSDFALMTLSKDDPSYGYFTEIKNTANRAANLTRQLLTFSRRQIIEPKTILINEILLHMDKLLRRLIGEDIELVIIPSDKLWYIMMDSGQIEQIITNIVINARDAMPDGGKIVIETMNTTIDDDNTERFRGMSYGDYTELKISDNGCGMDSETVSHIFEPFFTTKEEGKGTGLGLSTCYGIVEQNSGSIFVTSEKDKGTDISILLPRSFEEPAAHAFENTLDEIPGGSETILVAEDEGTVRRMIKRVLSRQGYTILEANNGEEALRLIEKTGADSISLVLTDVIMPQMGGSELFQNIEKEAPDMKVLFMSGYTDESILTDGFISGGLNFLKKPFSPADILNKVREVIDSEK